MSVTTKTQRHQEENRELPDGWRWVKLGEVCELNPRRPLIDRKDSNPTSFIPMEAVDALSGVISDLRVRPYGEVKKGYTYFAEGDVLFAKITPCMQNGKHAIAVGLIDGIGFSTTEFHVLRISKDIISELIWFFVRQPGVLIEATEHFTGAVGQQRLPQGYLANLEIPLPPLPEQQRIAGVLRERMAAVEKARTAAQARLAAVKALPASFLRQVFPQPGQPLPDGWRWVKLGEVCNRIDYGYTASADTDIKEPKFLRITDIQDGRVDWDSVPGCAILDADEIANRLEDGDIVFVRTGATTGKSYLISNPPRSVFASYLIRVRNHSEHVEPDYLFAFFQSDGYWEQIAAGARGGAQPGFNATMLASLKIPLSPLSEQQRIAAVLHEQMAAVENARAAAEAELNTINALPAALLRRAFNGDL
jgi:type I restriction enzyme S subunit